MKTLLLGLTFGLLTSTCGKVKDPTPKDTVLVEWDRSKAVQHDSVDPTKDGPKHSIADAKIVEGPETHAYTVTMTDPEGKVFAFDIDIDAAKLSELDSTGKEQNRWATTKVSVKLTQNDAFRITGKCDNRVAMAMGEIGKMTNTMMDCDVIAKRPNSMGHEDAITIGAHMQLEGSGKLIMNDPKAKIVSR